MCPDIINRYLSNVLTVDQIEALRNKTIDGSLNSLANIPSSAIAKIEDKTKLHDQIVYKDVPNQTLNQHVDVNLQGLQDGDKLEWDTATSQWVNVQITEGGGTGDVIGGANIGEEGASVYYQENASHILEFSKLKSLDSALSIVNNGSLVEFDLVDGSTTQKGIVQLATSGESVATKAVIGTDTRLSNSRAPTAHATTHKSGQSDVIKLDELGPPTDIATLNASSSNHGLLPKLSGLATDVFKGDGTFGAMSAGGSGFKAKNVNELSFSSTTALQTMLQFSFPANELGTDKIYEVVIEGTYLNDSGGTPKLQTKVSFDTTVMWDHTIGTISSASTRRVYRLVGHFHNKGVHNSQQFNADVSMSDSEAPTAGMGRTSDDEMTGKGNVSGTAAIATNAVNKVFKIELAHNSSNASIIFTRTLSYIRELV